MGVKFNSVDIERKFNIKLSKATIEPPEPNRVLVNVPGRNGTLDLTYALTPEIKFGNRNIALVLYLYEIQEYKDVRDKVLKQRIADFTNFIHGQQKKIILPDDPDYYWNCFCRIDNVEVRSQLGVISVSCEAEPYKLAVDQTKIEVPVTTTGTVTLKNTRMKVSPAFSSAYGFTVTQGSTTVAFPSGIDMVSPDITLSEGENELSLQKTAGTSVSSNIIIQYRQGQL